MITITHLRRTTVLASLVCSAYAGANVPAPGSRGELKHLRGEQYAPLTTAIENFQELPVGERDAAASRVAERALTDVRRALKTLESRADSGTLPINTSMSDQQIAKKLKYVRVATADACAAPVLAFYIFPPSGGTKYLTFNSYDAVPTIDEVRADNPGCAVHKVIYSFNPGVSR